MAQKNLPEGTQRVDNWGKDTKRYWKNPNQLGVDCENIVGHRHGRHGYRHCR